MIQKKPEYRQSAKNKDKLILEMIKAGKPLWQIFNELKGVSYSRVTRVFHNWVVESKNPKPFFEMNHKEPYYQNESDILDSLIPEYNAEDLTGEELIIYQNL